MKQGMDQKLGEGQEKLHQMWLSWNQKTPQGAEKDPANSEVPTRAAGAPPYSLGFFFFFCYTGI